MADVPGRRTILWVFSGERVRKVVVEPSNAWERAQEAIARAEERDAAVVTPDTAVSPFDASNTMVIPQAHASGRRPPDPNATQRLPHGPTNGSHRPRPREPAEPPTTPNEISDPSLVRASHPGTSPLPVPGEGAAAEETAREETPSLPTAGRRGFWRRGFWRRLFGS